MRAGSGSGSAGLQALADGEAACGLGPVERRRAGRRLGPPCPGWLCWVCHANHPSYSSARILLLVVSVILLYLVGARGLLLLALACVVSGIASFVLLSRQRDVMSGALMGRIRTGRRRAAGFRARIEEGARAEDED